MPDWITHLFPFAPPAFNIFFVALCAVVILVFALAILIGILLRVGGIGSSLSSRGMGSSWNQSMIDPANPLSPQNPQSHWYRSHHRHRF